MEIQAARIKEYAPFPEEVYEVLLAEWRLYCADIGLEGNLYLDLREKNTPEEAIEQKLNEYRVAKIELYPLYRQNLAELRAKRRK